jgi:hypothetical protein
MKTKGRLSIARRIAGMSKKIKEISQLGGNVIEKKK